jgi:hypothetical protein
MVRSNPANLAGARGRLSFHPELNVLESHRGHALLLSKSLPALGHQHWVYTSLGLSCAVRCLTAPTRTDRGVRRTFGGDSPEMNTLFNAPMRKPLCGCLLTAPLPIFPANHSPSPPQAKPSRCEPSSVLNKVRGYCPRCLPWPSPMVREGFLIVVHAA